MNYPDAEKLKTYLPKIEWKVNVVSLVLILGSFTAGGIAVYGQVGDNQTSIDALEKETAIDRSATQSLMGRMIALETKIDFMIEQQRDFREELRRN